MNPRGQVYFIRYVDVLDANIIFQKFSPFVDTMSSSAHAPPLFKKILGNHSEMSLRTTNGFQEVYSKMNGIARPLLAYSSIV